MYTKNLMVRIFYTGFLVINSHLTIAFTFTEEHTNYSLGTKSSEGSGTYTIDESKVFPNKSSITVKEFIDYWKKIFQKPSSISVSRIYGEINPERFAKMKEQVGLMKLKQGNVPAMKTGSGIIKEPNYQELVLETLTQKKPKIVELLNDNDLINFEQDNNKILVETTFYNF